MKKILTFLLVSTIWSASNATNVGFTVSRSGGDWTNFLDQPGFGNPDSTSTSYYIGRSGSRSYAYSVTFLNVSIPQGATIDTAYWVSSTAVIPDTADGMNIFQTLWGYDADTGVIVNDSTAWRILYNNRTTASTTEKVPINHSTWTLNTRFTMYDSVKAIIQEIVNRAGWVSGNSMTFVSRCDTATTTYQNRLLLSNYDRSSTLHDSLFVSYTASGGGSPSATPNVIIRSATLHTTTLRAPEKLFYRQKENWRW